MIVIVILSGIVIGLLVGTGTWEITSNAKASVLFGVATAGFLVKIFVYLEEILSFLNDEILPSLDIKGGEEE